MYTYVNNHYTLRMYIDIYIDSVHINIVFYYIFL